jgi:hypothetical protein
VAPDGPDGAGTSEREKYASREIWNPIAADHDAPPLNILRTTQRRVIFDNQDPRAIHRHEITREQLPASDLLADMNSQEGCTRDVTRTYYR